MKRQRDGQLQFIDNTPSALDWLSERELLPLNVPSVGVAGDASPSGNADDSDNEDVTLFGSGSDLSLDADDDSLRFVDEVADEGNGSGDAGDGDQGAASARLSLGEIGRQLPEANGLGAVAQLSAADGAQGTATSNSETGAIGAVASPYGYVDTSVSFGGADIETIDDIDAELGETTVGTLVYDTNLFDADQGIDALMNNGAGASSTFFNNPALTYSFVTAANQVTYNNNSPGGGLPAATFAYELNATQKAAAILSMNMAAGITPLTFTPTTGGNGNIRFLGGSDVNGATNGAGYTAFAYYPSTGEWGGDNWFNPYDYNAPSIGSFAFHTFMHELGHALGLKHGHETDGPGALPTAQDYQDYSIMTYRGYVGGTTAFITVATDNLPQSFMQLDIAALQRLYGANFNTNSGNTTYTFSTATGEMFIDGVAQGTPAANILYRTVWDGNGVDTYDFSNYSTSMIASLEPGSGVRVDNVGTFQRADLNGQNPGNNFAEANVFNALQFNGDARSLIENLKAGSGNDTIYGNAANNRIEGGAGTDTLLGVAGSDTLIGDAGNDILYGYDNVNVTLDVGIVNYLWGYGGNDTLHGAAGDDLLVGGAGYDIFRGYGGQDWIYVDTEDTAGPGIDIDGGAGLDRVFLNVPGGVTFAADAANVEVVFSGDGNDTLTATNSNSTVYLIGAGGNDTITGGNAVDVLWGYGDQDTLRGGGSTDWLYAGTGSDRLEGGAGDDYLIGGSGAGGDGAIDFYEFRDNWGVDRIYEFDDGVDIIDMSNVTGLTNLAQLAISDVAGGAGITYGGSTIYVIGTTASQLSGADFWL